jgi:hypothetical protein
MPRALLLGLGAVTLVYVSATLAFMYVIPIEQVGAGRGVCRAGRERCCSGPAEARWSRRGSCCVGAGQPRRDADAGAARVLRDGERRRVPGGRRGRAPALRHAGAGRCGAQAGLASVLVLLGTFESIVAYFIFVTVAFIALTVAAVFVIRRRRSRPSPSRATRGRPWRSWGWSLRLLVLLLLNNPVQAGPWGRDRGARRASVRACSAARRLGERGTSPRRVLHDLDSRGSVRRGREAAEGARGAAAPLSHRVRRADASRTTRPPTASSRRTRSSPTRCITRSRRSAR